MVRGQRAPEQHGNDQSEYDDFLVGARPKGGERLEQADHKRAGRRDRITRHPADDGGDKALETDQESGVVVNRRHRRDQHSGNRANERCDRERDAPRHDGADTHQPCTAPVDGSRAQGASIQCEAEKEPHQEDQHSACEHHEKALRRPGPQAEIDGTGEEFWCAAPFRAEEDQPEPRQGKMHGHRGDEQHQHGRLGQWLVSNAIEHRAERHDQRQRKHDVAPQGQVHPGQLWHQPDHDCGVEKAITGRTRERAKATRPQDLYALHRKRGHTCHQQKPDRGRRLAFAEHRQRQRAKRDELALRNKDHAGDGEHQHERQTQQGVDGAVDDAVLRQNEGD